MDPYQHFYFFTSLIGLSDHLSVGFDRIVRHVPNIVIRCTRKNVSEIQRNKIGTNKYLFIRYKREFVVIEVFISN